MFIAFCVYVVVCYVLHHNRVLHGVTALCAVLCPPVRHSPPSYVGAVSVLDVDTREDWVQRERREVCVSTQGLAPVQYCGSCCRNELVLLHAMLQFSRSV